MAERLDVPILAVGTELTSSVRRFPEELRSIIAAVRDVYRGELVYAANWDAALELGLWDAVDYIGLQFYPPLREGPATTVDAMERRMKGYMETVAELAGRWNRRVLFTEVGYKSMRGALEAPYEWPEHVRGQRVPSEATQALGYQVFLRGVAGRDFVAGVYFWKWFTDPASSEGGDIGFSPRGKLAEAVVRAAYDRDCESELGRKRRK
jgi:hypothetical protein